MGLRGKVVQLNFIFGYFHDQTKKKTLKFICQEKNPNLIFLPADSSF